MYLKGSGPGGSEERLRCPEGGETSSALYRANVFTSLRQDNAGDGGVRPLKPHECCGVAGCPRLELHP